MSLYELSASQPQCVCSSCPFYPFVVVFVSVFVSLSAPVVVVSVFYGNSDEAAIKECHLEVLKMMMMTGTVMVLVKIEYYHRHCYC
jgi:hypothetical protein